MVTKKVGLHSADCKETLQQERIYLNDFKCSAIRGINITYRLKTNQHFSLFQDKMVTLKVAHFADCKLNTLSSSLRQNPKRVTMRRERISFLILWRRENEVIYLRDE